MVPLLLLLAAATAAAALEGPCDILDAAGNPCVAAHSTVRALYSEYSGPLYNVTRSSDGTSKSISVLAAGGFANKPAHDAFCSKLDCVISNVFDQSPQHNHLGQRHRLINASRHSVTVGKDKTPVYGMWFDPYVYAHAATARCLPSKRPRAGAASDTGCNYPSRSVIQGLWLSRRQHDGHRDRQRRGVHLRCDERQEFQRWLLLRELTTRRRAQKYCMLVADAGLVGMHVIVALHSPRLLLQDYGNSETNDRDDGAGAMEAIYFGNAHWHGNTGGGATGPWVGADLEAGMYYGGGSKTRVNMRARLCRTTSYRSPSRAGVRASP